MIEVGIAGCVAPGGCELFEPTGFDDGRIPLGGATRAGADD